APDPIAGARPSWSSRIRLQLLRAPEVRELEERDSPFVPLRQATTAGAANPAQFPGRFPTCQSGHGAPTTGAVPGLRLGARQVPWDRALRPLARRVRPCPCPDWTS